MALAGNGVTPDEQMTRGALEKCGKIAREEDAERGEGDWILKFLWNIKAENIKVSLKEDEMGPA